MWGRGVLALSVAVVASSASAGAPANHWRHSEDSLLPFKLMRPGNDSSYIGWSRTAGAGRDCVESSPRFGCSHAEAGGRTHKHTHGGRWVYFGPQFTYVPGRGIIDEACNLPTSACPNTQRDGQ
jgi:hypothetical protein